MNISQQEGGFACRQLKRVRAMSLLFCGTLFVSAFLVIWLLVIPYLRVYPLVTHVRELGGSVGTRSIIQPIFIPTPRSIDKVDFSGADIGDADLATLSKALSRLPGLKYLILSDTNITDAGLRQLKSLDTLEYVYLDGTRVTEDGITYLKGELPNAWTIVR